MRLFKLIWFTIFSSVVAQSSYDLSSLLAQWSAIAPTVTQSFSMPSAIPTRLGNVDAPPTSLMLAIFTGVPQDVLVNLVNPAARESMKSDFAAGRTPSWYQALPTPVKEYIESINKAIKTGGNDYTGTEGPVVIPNYTADPNGPATTPSGPDDGQGNVEATSKSKGGAAPMPTWGTMEMLGLSGAVGILGIAVGL